MHLAYSFGQPVGPPRAAPLETVDESLDDRILRILDLCPASLADVVALTGIDRQSVYVILRRHVNSGRIARSGQRVRRRGVRGGPQWLFGRFA